MKKVLTKLFWLLILTAPITLRATTQDLAISAIITDVQCHGETDGSIEIDVDPPGTYSYYWNGVLSTQNLYSLGAGTYMVLVTNGIDSGFATYVVAQPPQISISGIVTNVGCGGKGKINITAIGGTPTYGYAWSNFSANEDLANLNAGTYTVTVSDYNSCTATKSFTVGSNGALSVNFSFVQNATCTNAGKLSATVSGGASPYTYVWKTCAGATIAAISGTPNKINANSCSCYQVTVSNATCSATRSYTIPKVALTKPSNCQLTSTLTCNTDFGSITSYMWNNNPALNTPSLDCISSGNYQVIVKNANGDALTTCSKAITVTPPLASDVRLNTAGTKVLFTLTGGCPPYTAAWTVSPTGTLTYYNTSTITNGQVKKLTGHRIYTVTVTDACGNSSTATSSTTLRTDVGIENSPSVNLFTVTPNPTSGIIDLNFNSDINNGTVLIYNISGQIVIQKDIAVDENNSIQLDLSNKPKGIYCIKIMSGELNISTQKVILN